MSKIIRERAKENKNESVRKRRETVREQEMARERGSEGERKRAQTYPTATGIMHVI